MTSAYEDGREVKQTRTWRNLYLLFTQSIGIWAWKTTGRRAIQSAVPACWPVFCDFLARPRRASAPVRRAGRVGEERTV